MAASKIVERLQSGTVPCPPTLRIEASNSHSPSISSFQLLRLTPGKTYSVTEGCATADCICELKAFPINVGKANLSDLKLKRHNNPDGTIGGFVSEDSVVGKNTYIHPTAVILGEVKVGRNVKIGQNVTIRYWTEIGNFVTIYDGANLDTKVTISFGTKILEDANMDHRSSTGIFSNIGAKAWIGVGVHIRHFERVKAGKTIISRNSTY